MKRLLLLILLGSIVFFACNTAKKQKTNKPVAGQSEIAPNSVLVKALVLETNGNKAKLKIEQTMGKGQGYNAPLKSGETIWADAKGIALEKGKTYTLELKALEQIGNTFNYKITKIK